MTTVEITSILLAALTAGYVAYTGRLNHHARESANAAARSATASEAATTAALETARASQKAAEAAERSAALSEAAIPVHFSARVLSAGGKTVILLRSDTASVNVFSVHCQLLVVPHSDGGIGDLGTSTFVNDEGEPVMFVHRGEEVLAALDEPLQPGDTILGHATVRYGFLAEQPGRDRLVEIPSQEVQATS